MKTENSKGGGVYLSPEINLELIAVENGFAASEIQTHDLDYDDGLNW